MSVDAKELRLGNFVLFNPLKEVYDFCQVKVINPKNVVVLHKGLELQLFEMEFKPIPLTIKLLKQCGFEYVGYGYNFPDKWIAFLSFHSKGKLGVFIKSGDVSTDVKIIDEVKYLHELQNLTYALTGTEINLTL